MKQVLTIYQVDNGFVVVNLDMTQVPAEDASLYCDNIFDVETEVSQYLGYFYKSGKDDSE